jgi:hypothetical protein
LVVRAPNPAGQTARVDAIEFPAAAAADLSEITIDASYQLLQDPSEG